MAIDPADHLALLSISIGNRRSAGNLATIHAVMTLLNQRLAHYGQGGTLCEAPTMFDAARIVGATFSSP